jgi:hypothetical protein
LFSAHLFCPSYHDVLNLLHLARKFTSFAAVSLYVIIKTMHKIVRKEMAFNLTLGTC